MSLGPINAPAFAELCWLMEQPDTRLLPDAIWLGGKRHLYQHLRDMQAVTVTQEAAPSIMCPYCTSRSIQPELLTQAKSTLLSYRAFCSDCGWLQLGAEQSRLWQTKPAKMAEWLNAALGLNARHKVEMVLDGVLWYLGDREIRRQRRSFFFGRRIDSASMAVNAALDRLAAPGAQALITTSDPALLKSTALADRQVVPLRAIAQLRKAHIVVENLDAYFDGIVPVVVTDETSLRVLHIQRAVLIDGAKVPVSPRVYEFLKVLEDAEGDEVHKRHIARNLGISAATFRSADIFKRHKKVSQTFVGNDKNGNFWLKPEFIMIEGR